MYLKQFNLLKITSKSVTSCVSCSKQYILQVIHFCSSKEEGGTHNSEAPNMQNIKCNGQSAWDVMGAHKDFSKYLLHFELKAID